MPELRYMAQSSRFAVLERMAVCARLQQQPRISRTQRSYFHVVCFHNTLSDILRGSNASPLDPRGPAVPSVVPGWLPWPFPPPAKQMSRLSRAERLKSLLRTVPGSPVIRFPSRANETESRGVDSFQVDPAPKSVAVSNALPFPGSAGVSTAQASPAHKNPAAQEAEVEQIRPVQELRAVLPWLFVAEGHFAAFCADAHAAEFIASHLALSRLHHIQLAHNAKSDMYRPPWILSENVAWMGASVFPSPEASLAATLHRGAHRCGGSLTQLGAIDGSAVVLTYRPEEAQKVAIALGLYFHLYGGLTAREAATTAGGFMQCAQPPTSALAAGVEEMAACGKGWLQRAILEWRYAGGQVEAAGEAVGGWDRSIPLEFNVRHKKWRVQLWGLPPGVYSYKFLVDGKWCTDVMAPSQMDPYGNMNNACVVVGCGLTGVAERTAAAADGMAVVPLPFGTEGDEQLHGDSSSEAGRLLSKEAEEDERVMAVTPDERLRLARFGAAILAYYMKSRSVRRPTPVRLSGNQPR